MTEFYFKARQAQAANSSVSANLTPGLLAIPNLTANGLGVYAPTVNAANITIGSTTEANTTAYKTAALNVVNQTNAATLLATTTANVGSNSQLTTTQIAVTNGTVTTVGTSTSLVMNGASANAEINPGKLLMGNSSVNAFVNSSATWFGNSTSSFQFNTTGTTVGISGPVLNSTMIAWNTDNRFDSSSFETLATVEANSSSISNVNYGVANTFKENSGDAFVGNPVLVSTSFSAVSTVTIDLTSFISDKITNLKILMNVKFADSTDLAILGLRFSNTTTSAYYTGDYGGVEDETADASEATDEVLSEFSAASAPIIDSTGSNDSGRNAFVEVDVYDPFQNNYTLWKSVTVNLGNSTDSWMYKTCLGGVVDNNGTIDTVGFICTPSTMSGNVVVLAMIGPKNLI